MARARASLAVEEQKNRGLPQEQPVATREAYARQHQEAITEYMGFATRMLLAFGLVFEVPVVVTFLAMVGLVNWKQLLKFGRWWIVIASIVAAVLTPPDVGSQMMMMTPLVVLYFMSVGLAYLFGPKVEPEPKTDDEAGSGQRFTERCQLVRTTRETVHAQHAGMAAVLIY